MSNLLQLRDKIRSLKGINRIVNTLYKVSTARASYWLKVQDSFAEFLDKFLQAIGSFAVGRFGVKELTAEEVPGKAVVMVFYPRQGLCGILPYKIQEIK